MMRPISTAAATLNCRFYGYNALSAEWATSISATKMSGVAFYDGRLAVSFTQPNGVVFLSSSNRFVDFLPVNPDGQIDNSTSISFEIGDRQDLTIRHLNGEMRDVLIFTDGGVWFAGIDANAASIDRINSVGAGVAQPFLAGEHLLYSGLSGRRLHALTYLGQDARKYHTTELTQYADHIFQGNINRIAYQHEPNRLVWAMDDTGTLASCTMDIEGSKFGFGKHVIAGAGATAPEVLDIVSATGRSGSDRRIFMVVGRDINSVGYLSIECLESPREYGDAIEDAKFLDCAAFYDGVSTTTPTGFDHLNGETVDVYADGVYVGPHTVSGGTFTLSVAASKVLAGYKFNSDIELLPRESSLRGVGDTDGANRVLQSLSIKLEESWGGNVGHDSTELNEIEYNEATPALLSRRVIAIVDGDREADSAAYIRFDEPYPAEISAIGYVTDYSSRGSEE
jgi:hypothetical protein